MDWLVSAVSANFVAVDRRVRRDWANRAKAVIQSESLSASTADPFLWKAPPNRNDGRSFARATLAAFEQATSRRWGGTVIPVRRNIPSDVLEGDMESETMQDSRAIAAEHSGVCGSERSFSIDSDGEPNPAPGGGNGHWNPPDDADYDKIQLVRDRWKALGLLWPDEDMCMSIISSRPGPSVQQPGAGKDANQLSQNSGAGASNAGKPGKIPFTVESAIQGISSWYADKNERRRFPGKLKMSFLPGSVSSSSLHTALPVAPPAHSEPRAGEIASINSDSPRSKGELPPVKAWGSLESEGVDLLDAPAVPKPSTRPKSQPGITSILCPRDDLQQSEKSRSSPGQQRKPRALRFA